jgi:trans-aconitate 2-methyltransferase
MKTKKQNDRWDAQHYKQHSQTQQMLGMDAIAKIDFRGDECVLDVGCGDGRITAAIAKKVSHGSVLGIDASKNMITEAQKSFGDVKNLTFQCIDSVKFSSDKKFDVVVSFSAFHWIKDQIGALKNIYHHLKPGGLVMIRTHAVHKGPVSDVYEISKWKALLADHAPTYFPPTAESINSMLTSCGFVHIDVQSIIAARTFAHKDELINWALAWVPHSTGLSGEKAREFARDIADWVGNARPDSKLVVETELLYARAVKPIENTKL